MKCNADALSPHATSGVLAWQQVFLFGRSALSRRAHNMASHPMGIYLPFFCYRWQTPSFLLRFHAFASKKCFSCSTITTDQVRLWFSLEGIDWCLGSEDCMCAPKSSKSVKRLIICFQCSTCSYNKKTLHYVQYNDRNLLMLQKLGWEEHYILGVKKKVFINWHLYLIFDSYFIRSQKLLFAHPR